MKNRKKINKCKYCHPFMGKNYDEYHCVVDGWEDKKVKVVNFEICEKCERFDSKFIEYPLTINGIENEKMDFTGLGHVCGEICEIKPCGEEYNGKSYVGIYLGDLPIAIHTSYSRESGILNNRTMNNPAIYVPELKKIIYGCESWWRTIKSIEDFKGISTEDIENTWYVKLLHALN